MVKGSFSFHSRRTMRMRGPPKTILINSQLKGRSHLKVEGRKEEAFLPSQHSKLHGYMGLT